MAGTINTDEIVLAADGYMLLAPKGTAGPTDLTSAWDPAWLDMGAVSDDGMKLKRNTDVKEIKVWQKLTTVKYKITGVSLTAELTLIEWNKNTVPFAFGGGSWIETSVGSGVFKYAMPATPNVDERAAGFQWDNGGINYRLYIPRVLLTEQGDITFKADDVAGIDATLGAMAPETGDTLAYLLSDDPDLG